MYAVGPRNKTDFVLRRIRSVAIPAPPFHGTVAGIMAGIPTTTGASIGGATSGGGGSGAASLKRRRDDDGDGGGVDVYRNRMQQQMSAYDM